MTKLMTACMEIIRMMLLMVMFVGLLSEMERRILSAFTTWDEYYGFFLLMGNLLLFFVLYRNKLQIHGWYRSSETQRKLTSKITSGCVTAGILCIMAPVIISWLG